MHQKFADTKCLNTDVLTHRVYHNVKNGKPYFYIFNKIKTKAILNR